MENLKRIREPLAWALIAVTAAALLLNAIQLAAYLVEANPEVMVGWIFSLQTADYALLLGLVAVAAGCALAPVVPRARTIARVAAWLAALSVALPVGFAVFALLAWPVTWSIASSSFSPWVLVAMLYPLMNVTIGTLAAVALFALARPPREDDAAAVEDGPGPADRAESSDDPADDDHPTVWKPAEASGTVWRTADEAAAGIPGARSLEPESGSRAAEWAQEGTAPEPAPRDDWRPPATS